MSGAEPGRAAVPLVHPCARSSVAAAATRLCCCANLLCPPPFRTVCLLSLSLQTSRRSEWAPLGPRTTTAQNHNGCDNGKIAGGTSSCLQYRCIVCSGWLGGALEARPLDASLAENTPCRTTTHCCSRAVYRSVKKILKTLSFQKASIHLCGVGGLASASEFKHPGAALLMGRRGGSVRVTGALLYCGDAPDHRDESGSARLSF